MTHAIEHLEKPYGEELWKMTRDQYLADHDAIVILCACFCLLDYTNKREVGHT